MDDLDCCVVAQGNDTVIAVFVQPRASKNAVCGLQGDELKLRLTSPPVEGAANKLCCEYLAKLLGCPKRSVSLISGHKSRHKRLLAQGVSCDDAHRRLLQAFN